MLKWQLPNSEDVSQDSDGACKEHEDDSILVKFELTLQRKHSTIVNAKPSANSLGLKISELMVPLIMTNDLIDPIKHENNDQVREKIRNIVDV